MYSSIHSRPQHIYCCLPFVYGCMYECYSKVLEECEEDWTDFV